MITLLRGKHVSKYIPTDELEAYREATENCRLFMEAVDNYIEEISIPFQQA